MIILDNGHGVETRGKRSPDGKLIEYQWAREFVYYLNLKLRELCYDTYILVPEESDVSLGNRALRANSLIKNLNKDIYEPVLLSIHINAASSDGKYHDARGFTSWVYTKGSEKSRKLGYMFASEAELNRLVGNRWIPTDKYHTANFKILKETNCPAVLLENMFMDNKEDEEFLLSEEGRNKLLDMYIDVIKTYESYINK